MEKMQESQLVYDKKQEIIESNKTLNWKKQNTIINEKYWAAVLPCDACEVNN